jgi:hypothetical protein
MNPMDRLTQAVDELVTSRTHEEPYTKHIGATTVVDRWKSAVPPLLVQLATVPPGGGVEHGHRVPGSRPQAHLDALDTLIEIDHESAAEVAKLGGKDRGETVANLRALVGLCTNCTDPEKVKEVAFTAWGWRTRASVITGWELPPRTPNNTCPNCAQRGTLRVRLDVSTGTGTAFCLHCRTPWDEQEIGLLAEHIRWENRELVICTSGLDKFNELLMTVEVPAA